MEALCLQPLVEDKVMMQEDELGKRSGEEEGGATEASSPAESTTEEETEEDSEPEPPVVVRRKVSFADAFGLNLVSVKEFDNVEVTEAEVSQSPKGEATHPLQEFYMSCLFTVPSSPEELDLRLQAQMVELESIELLPGTTTLRGIIRVVNVCYTKFVYVRLSLDQWNSYFDLLAEYVPGSSDIKTDRFTFKYTLVPPFGREGTRVEFCLRYETSGGTFWANNKDMNYVLFCHQRGLMKEQGLQVGEESASHKRSCLKAKRRGSLKNKIITVNTATQLAETDAAFKTAEGDRRTADYPEIQASHCKEHKRLVCSRRNQDRATREACVKDYLSQRRQQMPQACSPDSASGQKVSQPALVPLTQSDGFLYKCQKKHSNEVLTYHQIPLMTLDWNNDKQREWENCDMDDIWFRGEKLTLAGALQRDIEDRGPGNNMWESLLNGTDENADKGSSVCEVWQAFLNGPDCKDHSGVPESEWLQTAASVSPSNHEKPQNRCVSSSEGFQKSQVGTDTPPTLHARALAACQLLSAIRETQLADVSLSAEDHQAAEGCGRSTGDDNTVSQDASQRSQTKTVTDTPQEFSLKGATPVSEGSVDSSTKCHKHAIWEREREEIIGEAGAIGEDEPFTLHIADLVTSSGESKTTDMTAMPESPNARAVDRISQGARLHEGLSSSREKGVTGTAHNATGDTLAFKETIRQGTKDGEGFVASTSRRAAEEKIVMNRKENGVSAEEEIFRPLKTEECEISQSYVDEKECEEFRMSQNEGSENEMGPLQPHGDGVNRKQLCEESCAVKPKTEEHVLVSNQTEEEKCLSGLLRETNPSSHTAHSSDEMKVSQCDRDRIRPFSADKGVPNPVEVVKARWTHSQKDDASAVTPEEITVKETVAQKDTLTEARRQRAPLRRTEEYMSQRGEDERVSVGKLEIDAMAELMGNVDGPWEERENTLAELKEQELSAEVETHQPVESKILSEATKDPITAENTVAHEVMESGLEGTLIERFAEDLVRGICEEVFSWKEPDCNRDTNTVGKTEGGMAGTPDTTHDCHVLGEKGFNGALDSTVFSFSTGPNVSLCQVPKPNTATRSNKRSPRGKSQSLATADPAHSPSELQTDFSSSAHLSQDLSATLAAQSGPSLTESAAALSSGRNQEGSYRIKKRSVAHQEAGGQTEAQKERFNQSAPPSHKHLSNSSETLKESGGLISWTILCSLSHITRLLVCALLVVGSFVLAFLYDLPAFFALYIFSLCYWWYKWRRRQAATNKAMTG
ncbi:uncharacterized protein ppp1r3aa [Betta splendens]|uniref:Uncharacterized protein ppp1r3aa n=1 Tax=Betta splendens TaxID=158456 RepID=A0A6P7NAB0_BETSP|nr:uncharacterized protein ppp1r3aa [Betta splendens]